MLFNLDLVLCCLKSSLAACLLIFCHIFSLGDLVLNGSQSYLLFTVAFNHVIPSSTPYIFSVSMCVTSVKVFILSTSTNAISDHSHINSLLYSPSSILTDRVFCQLFQGLVVFFSLLRILEGEGWFYCNSFCHIKLCLFPTPQFYYHLQLFCIWLEGDCLFTTLDNHWQRFFWSYVYVIMTENKSLNYNH